MIAPKQTPLKKSKCSAPVFEPEAALTMTPDSLIRSINAIDDAQLRRQIARVCWFELADENPADLLKPIKDIAGLYDLDRLPTYTEDEYAAALKAIGFSECGITLRLTSHRRKVQHIVSGRVCSEHERKMRTLLHGHRWNNSARIGRQIS